MPVYDKHTHSSCIISLEMTQSSQNVFMGLAATPRDLLSLQSTSALLQQMDTLRDLQRHLDDSIWASASHSVFQGEFLLLPKWLTCMVQSRIPSAKLNGITWSCVNFWQVNVISYLWCQAADLLMHCRQAHYRRAGSASPGCWFQSITRVMQACSYKSRVSARQLV